MKKNNLIVITGGPSAGKTTLLNQLEKEGYQITPEMARVLIDKEREKGRTTKEIRKNELKFQDEVLKMKISFEKKQDKNKLVFLDRGIPDTSAYLKLIGKRQTKLLKKSLRHCSYQNVFLLKQLPFKKDYARTESPKQAKQLEKLLLEAYNRVGIDPVIVPVMSRHKRLKFVLSFMKEKKKDKYDSYSSVFSWRYGSEEMRKIFSERNKYLLWRKIWVTIAKHQKKAKLISKVELDDLIRNQNKINITRILQIEKQTGHDVVAAIKEFAEQAKKGGGKIHLGATSYDIVDNAATIQTQQALDLIQKQLVDVLKKFKKKIKQYADLTSMGFTHLQPAEPTTVGYRLAFYAQDLLIDLQLLRFIETQLKAKGLKGAVGTSASFVKLLVKSKVTSDNLEKKVMKDLGLDPLLITSQVSTKKFDYLVLSSLNSIASSAAKFANDLRIMQSPSFGEWSEPFGKKQVGSSAMPFKKNPISSEKIVSLARYIAALPSVVAGNVSNSYLERTLDDSANRRVIFPDAFLATDEILTTFSRILEGLVVHENRIQHNLSVYGSFAATENIIIELVKKGVDRQKAHELLRQIAMKTWEDIQNGKSNPIKEFLMENTIIAKYLKPKEIEKLLDVSKHTGTAKRRALQLVKKIQKAL